MTSWVRSWRADPRAAALADRHYSRQTPGAAQFVPPGRDITLLHLSGQAVWVTSWPKERFTKHEWAGAWVCSLFRNETPDLSSALIREACAATRAAWGDPPPLGLVTFIDPTKVRRKRDPGRCFLRAGFRKVGYTKERGLVALQLDPADFPAAAPALERQPQLFDDASRPPGGTRRVTRLGETRDGAPANSSSASCCAWCSQPIPAGARRDSKFCGQRCRQAAWRFSGHVGRAVASISPRRFAYADPPYPGMAARHYGDHPDYAGEVDHQALVRRLVSEYPDGWALSTSSRSLADVLALCPPGVRIGAWTKPAPPTRALLSRSAWEPVIFAGGRPAVNAHSSTTVLDWVHAAPMRAYPGAVVGTKPPAFCAWVFRMLGAAAGDRLDDLFPGSGAVAHAWAVYTSARGDGDASSITTARAPATGRRSIDDASRIRT